MFSFSSHIKPEEEGIRITVFYLLCSRCRNEVILALLSFLFESVAFKGVRKRGVCSIRRSHKWSIFRGATFHWILQGGGQCGQEWGWGWMFWTRGTGAGKVPKVQEEDYVCEQVNPFPEKAMECKNDHCLMLLLCLTISKYVVQEYQVWSAAELGLIDVHCRWRVNGPSVWMVSGFLLQCSLRSYGIFLLWVTKEQYLFLHTFCVCEIWYARWDRQKSATSFGQLKGRWG